MSARVRPSRLSIRALTSALVFALADAAAVAPTSAWAQTAREPGIGVSAARPSIDRLIEEAARRFGVPPSWVRAVMRQESGFDPDATSRAGAMGLMQVMPATYAELRRRHGLGADPYDPRDNILAGTAYLRELHDRFGPEGMLPAYNAGPGRYLQHRDEGRPLPAETRDYVARLSARIGIPSGGRPADPNEGPIASSPERRARRTPLEAPVDSAAAPLFPTPAWNPPPPSGAAASRLFVVFTPTGVPETEDDR